MEEYLRKNINTKILASDILFFETIDSTQKKAVEVKKSVKNRHIDYYK